MGHDKAVVMSVNLGFMQSQLAVMGVLEREREAVHWLLWVRAGLFSDQD